MVFFLLLPAFCLYANNALSLSLVRYTIFLYFPVNIRIKFWTENLNLKSLSDLAFYVFYNQDSTAQLGTYNVGRCCRIPGRTYLRGSLDRPAHTLGD